MTGTRCRRLRGALHSLALERERAPLGAPPWRFSARGSALPSPALSSGARAGRHHPGAGHSARRADPVPPETAVTSRRRGTPHLAPSSGSSPETPLAEQGGSWVARSQIVVNKKMHIVNK